MVQSKAETVEEYVAELPPDRAAVIEEVRELVLANLPDGIEESMNFGMIAFEVPMALYPDTYNGQPLMYAALAEAIRAITVDDFIARYESARAR